MAGQNGAYCFKYVSIWTASFDAVFGQRLRLPKNVIAFFGLTKSGYRMRKSFQIGLISRAVAEDIGLR